MSWNTSSTLIIGNGQLGQEFHQALPGAHWWARQELDLTDLDSISAKLSLLKPNLIINTAAYTAVDRAEDDSVTCDVVNHLAVQKLSEWCAKNQAALVHFSTDYVFSGEGDHFYTESDTVAPKNQYGLSKAAGEKAVLQSGCQFWIFRISWVYSAFGRNFVKTMLRLFREKETLNVVHDQIGSPVSTASVVAAVMSLVVSPKTPTAVLPGGIYHLRSNAVLSWFDFASLIREQAMSLGYSQKIKNLSTIDTQSYPTRAVRPLNSRLSVEKISQYWEIPDLKTDLKNVLIQIKHEFEGDSVS